MSMRLPAVTAVFLSTFLSTASAWAGAPKLEVSATKWKDGRLTVDVSVHARSGERVSIGTAKKPWQPAITIEVFDGDGLVAKWPFAARDSAAAQPSIVLTRDTGGGRTFELTAAQVAGLKPGAYQVIATLDLEGAGGGFEGVVRGSTPVTIAGAAPSAGPSAANGDPLTELKDAVSKIKTPNGLMRVEGLLLDAPELEPGPLLDAAVKAHLVRLSELMESGVGFAPDRETRDGDAYRPKRELVRAKEAQLTPYRVSEGFKVTLGAAKTKRAATLEAFWKFIHDTNGVGVHVLSVRTLGDVARVATVLIARGGPAVQRVEVSFWRREGSGWDQLSFQPWPDASRDLWSNVFPGGEAKRSPAELTDAERKQYLELRLGIVEISDGDYRESGRGDVSLSRGFGAGAIDKTYVPLLDAALRSTKSAEVRSAVMAELMTLGKAPSDETALELLADESLKGEARQQLMWRLDKKLHGGRVATAAELSALLGGAPSKRGWSARFIDASHAVLREDDLGGGQSVLYRKEADGSWTRLTVLETWVH